MKNDLLPNRERLQRFNLTSDDKCLDCKEHDGFGHFLSCEKLGHIVSPIKNLGTILNPNLTIESLANVDFELEETDNFSVVWLLAETVNYIWKCKRKQEEPSLATFKGILKADIQIMSYSKNRTKYKKK